MNWPWSELGLTGPAGLPEIRHAYAQRLKTTHPEEDPEGFQRLHSAYLMASRLARRAPFVPREPEPPKEEPGDYEPPYAEDIDPESVDWDPFHQREEESCYCEIPNEQPPEPLDGSSYWDLDWDALEKETARNTDPQKTMDWDFDRLFAEGQAERDAAFRRQAEESRRRHEVNHWGTSPEGKSAVEEAAWAAVLTALHALELLASTGASLPVWQDFLHSEAFWNAKNNLDFVFGLEDFLEDHPELPPEVLTALFLAYRFDSGPVRLEFRPLYRALGGDGRRRACQEANPRRKPLELKKLMLFIGVAILLTLGVGTILAHNSQPKETWQERICRYLEEDFDRAFLPFSEEKDNNLFVLEDDPELVFLAAPEGERDPENDKRGYKTNYTNVLITQAMEAFTEEWDYGLTLDSAGGYEGQPGESPGAYYISMPLSGGDGGIIAIGGLLEELAQEDWYQELPPVFEIQLCYRIWSFYTCVPTEYSFDTDYARTVYLNKLGPEMCRHLADWSGAAKEDLGESEFVLIEQGSVLIDGDTFFWVSALEPPPESGRLAEYYLSEDGLTLVCVPVEMVSPTLSQADLFAGTPETRTLEGYEDGLTVWDLIR
ncbi:MAG: hypothetical protein HFF18_03950 [Oscillospiraceae bacterium]|nr:hypothetical protein [Oscillospiraceae bacterium]